MTYVRCPATMTSPVPDYGLLPDLECLLPIPVRQVAQVMHFKCPRGHDFYAKPCDVVPPPQGKFFLDPVNQDEDHAGSEKDA